MLVSSSRTIWRSEAWLERVEAQPGFMNDLEPYPATAGAGGVLRTASATQARLVSRLRRDRSGVRPSGRGALLPHGDEDRADDQRGAEAGGQRDLLVEQDGAEQIATSGFTYWCVTTFEIGAFRSSQAYAVKPSGAGDAEVEPGCDGLEAEGADRCRRPRR